MVYVRANVLHRNNMKEKSEQIKSFPSIDSLIDLKKTGPEANQLKTYIGQVIKVTGFELAKSFVHKNDEARPTVKMTFVDSSGDSHTVMTSATFIVKQLLEVQKATGFCTEDSKINGFTAKLEATTSFGKKQHFRFASPDEPKEQEVLQDVTEIH